MEIPEMIGEAAAIPHRFTTIESTSRNRSAGMRFIEPPTAA
jgi:hypothetical protein